MSPYQFNPGDGPDLTDPNTYPSQWDPAVAQQFATQLIPYHNPNLIPSPGMRIGPLRLSGSGLDAASLAVLSALQNGPRPQGFGQSFAAGLAGGLAQGRFNQAQGRAAANQLATEGAAQDEKDRRAAAREFAMGLARHRWDMQGKETKSSGSATVHVGADPNDPQRVAAQAAGISLPPGEYDAPLSLLTRDMPQKPDETILALRESLLQQRKDAVAKAAQDAADKQAELDKTAAGVADFTIDPTRISRDPASQRYIENKANQILQSPDAPKHANGKPYSVRELQELKKNQENFYKTMDQQQMNGWRQSAATARQHLDQFKQFFQAYGDRVSSSPIRTIGMGKFQMAHEGFLGQDAQRAAQALDPVAEALPLEIAKVISGNRVPYEMEVKAAAGAKRTYVDPFLSSPVALAKLASTTRLLDARIKSQYTALPYAGTDNPFLLDVNPIKAWEDAGLPDVAGAPGGMPTPTAPKQGGWFHSNAPKTGGRR